MKMNLLKLLLLLLGFLLIETSTKEQDSVKKIPKRRLDENENDSDPDPDDEEKAKLDRQKALGSKALGQTHLDFV